MNSNVSEKYVTYLKLNGDNQEKKTKYLKLVTLVSALLAQNDLLYAGN